MDLPDRPRFSWFAMVFVALGLTACGGGSSGGGSDSDDDDTRITLAGVVQKGPFTQLSVTARPMNDSGELGDPLPVTVEKDRYSLKAQPGQNIRLEATGTFLDETTGNSVTLKDPLRAVAVAGKNASGPHNINVMTDMGTALFDHQTDTSLPVKDRLTNAQSSLMTALGLPQSTDPRTLDLAQVTGGAELSDPNLSLLLLSGSIMTLPRTDDAMPNGYQAMLTGLGQGLTPEEVLPSLAGIDAADLYEQIRDTQVLPDLPNLSLDFGNTWLCNPSCDWEWLTDPSLSLSDITVLEALGSTDIVLRRSGLTADLPAMTIDLTSQEDTALDGFDFVGIDETVSFTAGQRSQTVTLPLLIDSLDESIESLGLTVSNPSTTFDIQRDTARVSILDSLPDPGTDSGGISAIDTCLIGSGPPSDPTSLGCTPMLSPQDDYVMNAPYALGLALGVQADCTVSAGCTVLNENWPMSLTLLAEADGEQQDSTHLGDYLYPADALFESNQSLNAVQPLQASLNSPNVQDFLLNAWQQGWQVRLQASLTGNDPTRTAHADLPKLIPVPDTIEFGEESLAVSPTGLTLNGSGSLTCADDEWQLDGGYVWSVDYQGQNAQQSLTGEVCASLDLSGDDPVLVVTQGSVPLESDGSPVLVPLPAAHRSVIESNLAYAYGASDYWARQSTAQTYLILPATNLGALYRQYLTADSLPFGYWIDSGELGPQGIRLIYTGLKVMSDPLFEASDPRASEFRSNSAIYAQGQAGTLTLADAGINDSTSFNAGSAQSGWPAGSVQWDAFTVSVQDSHINDSTVALDYDLAQSTACRSADCLQGVQAGHQVTGTARLGHDGTLLAHSTVTGSDGVRWGDRPDGPAWQRPQDLANGEAATLVLPGFIAPGDAPVVDHLRSHRVIESNDVSAHGPGSSAFRRGNHFPPGLTVGPQFYANDQGQPATGSGSDIGQRTLSIDVGNDTLSLTGHAASKYVLQNGGVTGVFNVDPPDLIDPVSIYGYNIAFDRFAVRLRENRMDTRNWVDGGVALPGDAGFDVAFESLSIDCGGQLGQARLAPEQCTSDAGCSLSAWHARTDFFDFQFTAQSGETSPQCGVADQYLTLQQDADFLALDKALMLDVTWSAQGDALRTGLNNQDQYRLDATDDEAGFPVALSEATLQSPWDEASVDSGRYGTIALGGLIGVPFWQALDTDIRVANEDTDDTAAPSVPLRRHTLMPDNDGDTSNDPPSLTTAMNQQPNRDLLLDLAEENQNQYDLAGRYEWGNTGFGFQLPVYYDLPQNRPGPQFIGRTWNQDLFVLEANAGIDYITPGKTKLSFGASADFERLGNLRFQIDLDSLESLSKVDQLLIDAGLLSEPVLEPTLGTLTSKADLLNDFANQGVDVVMEEALLAALEEVGAASAPLMPGNEDPIVVLANALAEIRSYPDQLIASLDDELMQPIVDELSVLENNLRSRLSDLETALNAAQSDLTDPTRVSDLRTAIDDATQMLDTVHDIMSALVEPVDDGLDQALAGLDRLDAPLNQASTALGEVDAMSQRISDFAAAQCNTEGSSLGIEVDGFLHSTWQHLGNLQSLLELLEGGEVLTLLADRVIEDPATQESMRNAGQTIARNAELLTTQLSEAEQSLRSNLCATDVQNVLARVDDYIGDIQAALSHIEGLQDTVHDELTAVQNSLAGLQDQLLTPLEGMKTALEGIDDQIDNNGNAVVTQYLIDELNFATDGAVNTLVADPNVAGEVDIIGYAFDGARDLLDQGRERLVTALQNQIQGEFQLPLANMDADQMRRHLVAMLLDSAPVKSLRVAINEQLTEIGRQVNDNLMMLADQANQAVREALQQVENKANEALAAATAPVRDIPLSSASMDGYGVIAGQELERAHVQAEWTMKPASEGEPGNTFGAALSAVSWSASNKDEGCAATGAGSNLDVTIAAMNLPARIGTSDITLKKVYLGFTLANATGGDVAFNPMGVYGGLAVVGDIGFTEFIIYDPAFAAGLGSEEVYIGASAGALFSDIQAEVAFLMGRTCNKEVLLELDPTVAKFIPLPDSGFSGAYVRGSASIPVWVNGCPLTVGASADMGAWVLTGPPLTLGGLVGGGAYGKVLCVGALRGQVRAMGTVTSDGDMSFVGEGFGVAGAGFCEPASWTSVSRSRNDDWCGTGDARFQAGYQNGWSIMDLSTSAIH